MRKVFTPRVQPAPEISRAFVAAVVVANHLDRKAGNGDGDVVVGDRERADLLVAGDQDRNLRGGGAAALVVNREAQRIGAIDEERGIKSSEDTVGYRRRSLIDQGERRVAGRCQRYLVPKEVRIRRGADDRREPGESCATRRLRDDGRGQHGVATDPCSDIQRRRARQAARRGSERGRSGGDPACGPTASTVAAPGAVEAQLA